MTMTNIKFASVCSGIEAASVAFEPLGFEPQWFSEIEPFPCAVLNHHFPKVPNLGDMTKLINNETFKTCPIDLMVGGTPCQSFSIAGLRKGLNDARGNLMLEFLRLVDAKKPKWIIWENVPGVLSSNGGRDFGTFLQGLAECGYGFAYRILDSQYFGVAQRRRRVFVIGYFGDWRCAAAVLFEQESLFRDFKKGRKKREKIATDAETGIGNTGKSWWDGGQTAGTLTKKNADGGQRMPDKDNFRAVIEQVAQPIAYSFDSLSSNSMKSNNPNSGCREVDTTKTIDTTIPEPSKNQCGIAIVQPVHAFKIRGGCEGGGKKYIGQDESAFTLSTHQDQRIAQPNIIDRAAFNQGENAQYEPRIEHGETMSALIAKGPHAISQPISVDFRNNKIDGDIACTLQSKGSGGISLNYQPGVLQKMAIRRLTPKECERLQGFPDDWTKIPYRNKSADQCPDGLRYKACGNSMAVPVMRWLGQRIQLIESLMD